jgi:integrase
VEAVLKPKSDVKRIRLTLDDFKAILAEARKARVDCWMANAMELALMCGQRREDIAKMKFEDIKDGYLLVEQSKGKEERRAKLRIPLELRLDTLGLTLEDVLKRCRDQVLSKNVIHLVRKTGNVEPGTAPKSGTLSIKFAHFREKSQSRPAARRRVFTRSGRSPPGSIRRSTDKILHKLCWVTSLGK